MKRSQCCAALALLAAGCVSTAPPQYFTLNMEASNTAVAAAYNLDVERLRPSEALARKEIIVKKSPTEIEYYKRALWAQRIDELVREKLESEFGPDREEHKTLLITGTILAFEQMDAADTADAHIKVALELRFSGDKRGVTVLEKTYDLRIPAQAKEPAAVVKALSQGVEQLAASIVKDANAL